MKKFLVLVMSVVMLMSMTACGGEAASPTDTADGFLKAFKAQDVEALKSFYASEDFDLINSVAEDSDEEMAGIIEDNLKNKIFDFDYTLSNEKIDGDKATVDVEVKTYDLGKAFSEFFSEYITQAFSLAFSESSEDEIEALGTKLMGEKFSGLTEKTYSGKFTLNLSKKDDKWLVDDLDDNEDACDVMLGGMISAIKKMGESFAE